MKELWKKWICMHKWIVHAKEPLKYAPHLHYTEVLICDICGKVKIIEY